MKDRLTEQYTNLELELINAIYESYNNHLVKNAIFLAERLVAEKPNIETKVILAECYLADGKPYKCSYILKGHNTNPSARYLLALAYIKQNKYDQAERALKLSATDIRPGLLSSHSSKNFVNGSFGLYLMGQICEKRDQKEAAVEYYQKAFIKNPSLWVAYERLCDLGYRVRETDLGEYKEGAVAETGNLKKMSVFEDLVSDNFRAGGEGNKEGMMEIESSGSASKKRKNYLTRSAKSKTTKNTSAPRGNYESLSQLVKSFMKAYHEMSNFNIKAATKAFNNLSSKQRNTGWVLSKLGQCFFSVGKYNQAIAKFKEAFSLEPYRLEGVEYYSSCLWHLDDTAKLCEVAFKAFDMNPFSPEAWVAMGNCYSKHNDHEAALKFFHRAVELDQTFSYAHCLRGHEFAYSDMFTDAITCYQEALNVDQKCFFANWGLGNVYLKQEKYERAINNFILADKINGNHPIIKSSIGLTFMHQDKREEALEWFQHSERLDPTNLYNQFNKATVLTRKGENEKALEILHKLLQKSPKEFQIHLMIGKIYANMGDSKRALEFYHIALDLNPKENQRVKSLIDSLTQRNDFSETMGY